MVRFVKIQDYFYQGTGRSGKVHGSGKIQDNFYYETGRKCENGKEWKMDDF